MGRSVNQGKFNVVKQKIPRLNILGISELKWMGISKFKSDGHRQESLRRNGVALIVNQRA